MTPALRAILASLLVLSAGAGIGIALAQPPAAAPPLRLGAAPAVNAACKVAERGRLHGPQGFESPAARAGLSPLAYWTTRKPASLRAAVMPSSSPRQGGLRGNLIARGRVADLRVVPAARGYGALWRDDHGAYVARITPEGQLGFISKLDTSRGPFFRGALTSTDRGFAAAWSVQGDGESARHIFAQALDLYGRALSPAVQMVDGRGYRFRDVDAAFHPQLGQVALVWGEFASGERVQSRIWFQRWRPPYGLEPPRPFAVRFGDDCAQGRSRARSRRDVVFVRATQEAQIAHGGGRYGVAWTTRCDNAFSAWFTVLAPDGRALFLPHRLSAKDGSGSKPRVAWDGNAFAVAWEDRRRGQNRIAFQRIGPDGQKGPRVEVFAVPPTARAARYPWGPSVAWDGASYLVGYNGADDSRHLARISCE